MLIEDVNLSHCINIKSENSWDVDFAYLKEYFPLLKKKLSPDKPMGIGLKISDTVSKFLVNDKEQNNLKAWLTRAGGYVATINSHYDELPDAVNRVLSLNYNWISADRKNYTIRLAKIMQGILPDGMDGSISTYPLNYRHLFIKGKAYAYAKTIATNNIINVICHLVTQKINTGKSIHLDISPKSNGMIETGNEFINWFENDLQPVATPVLMRNFQLTYSQAIATLKNHLRLCYDIGNFSGEFENHKVFIEKLQEKKIKIGKIKINAILMAHLPAELKERFNIVTTFSNLNKGQLNQVVARKKNNELLKYRDISFAINDFENDQVNEWRVSFHVPVSSIYADTITSSQSDIIEVFNLIKKYKLTQLFEIEIDHHAEKFNGTQIPLTDLLHDELEWVIHQLSKIG